MTIRTDKLTGLLVSATFAGLLLGSTAHAQVSAVGDDHRHENVRDFDFMVEKITSNYAGYESKVSETSRPELERLTQGLRDKAATVAEQELFEVLQEWLRFFNDGHVGIQRLQSPGEPEQAPSTPYASLDADEDQVLAQLERMGPDRKPIEGIWTIGESYRIAIMRGENTLDRYIAVVVSTTNSSWLPGQVKAELTHQKDGTFDVLYRAGNHAEYAMEGSLIAGNQVLQLNERQWGSWIREWPPIESRQDIDRIVPSGQLTLRPVSGDTLWLRIPDFRDSRAAAIQTLIDDNIDALSTTPNLVLDLRQNSGGSDYVYRPLLRFLYTRPIYSIGIEYRATPDNATLRRELADRLEADSPQAAADLRRDADLMDKNSGTYFNPFGRDFSIKKFDVTPFPKRVAILIDGAGSTGEQILLDARQSRKVTLFGKENSAGVLDFANIGRMTLPSGRFSMHWATSRSLRLPEDPVDGIGIAPDIRIPADVDDPVAYAAAWLERQLD